MDLSLGLSLERDFQKQKVIEKYFLMEILKDLKKCFLKEIDYKILMD